MICSVVGLFVFIPSVCLYLFTCVSVRLFVLFVTLFCFGLFVCLFVFCFVCVLVWRACMRAHVDGGNE